MFLGSQLRRPQNYFTNPRGQVKAILQLLYFKCIRGIAYRGQILALGYFANTRRPKHEENIIIETIPQY